MTINEQPIPSDGNATVAARSPTRITDSMTAVLNPDDPNTLKGPDPSEWPAAQLVPPEGADRGDCEVKGPDPEKWPQTSPEAAQTPPGIVSEQPYDSAPDVVTGVVEPPT